MICPQCQAENLPDSRFCHKCATPLYTEKEGAVPHTLTLEKPMDRLSRGALYAGRYEVIEELGKGGMGRVYKVFDQKIKEIVALKLIHPEISVNEKAVERFRNELKFARKISHRNVCRMYDFGEEGFMHFITMEYVDGENLKGFIKRAGQLTAGKAVSIARQVCEGLSEAHRLGIIHRDLKPQNIMIDREGNARIMDFGIARFLEAEGLTGSGVMVGTPEYMSPEQVELKEVDKRADIYSLGVILYEMATGKVPFEGETPLTIIIKHKSEPPPDPRDLNPQMPEEVARVMLKCLEKDKEKRYQSTEELLKDLTLIEQALPTAERVIAKKTPAPAKEIMVTFRLKKIVWPVLAMVLFALVALFIWKPFSRRHVLHPTMRQIPQVGRGITPRPPKPKELPPERFKEEVPSRLKVVVDRASILETPEIEGKVIARVPFNTILNAEQKQREWYKVTWEKEGVTGYIQEMLLEKVSEKELAQLEATGSAGQGKPKGPTAETKKQSAEKTERHELDKDIASLLTSEALKYLSPKDIKDMKDVDKLMENLKSIIPQGSSFSEALNKVSEKMREWKKLQEEGKVEEANKSQKEGQEEMQKLLLLVSEREEAQKAQSLLNAAKSQAQENHVDDRNLLYRVASRREQDAIEAYKNNDFSGAKTLSVVLERVFRLSIQCGDDKECLQELSKLIGELRNEAERTYTVSMDPWLYEKAKEYENKANPYLARGEFENAAESFIQAAFLYQKIKDKASAKK